MTTFAFAGASFQKQPINGAKCGDGSPYNIYIREGDPEKVLIHFQGGGACWDSITCFGPVPFTRLKEEGVPKDGIFSESNVKGDIFSNYTYVFLPYCTGDIHVGTHTAKYIGREVHHQGRNNAAKVFEFLEQEHDQLLSHSKKLVVYGESAGALGAMMNLDLVEPYVSQGVDKTVIPDSAGLHFSSFIWSRFSKEYLADVATAMQNNHMKLDPESGIIAKQLKEYCDHYKGWKMGFIQSTRDFVMSLTFGERTTEGHRAKVLGKEGLAQTLKSTQDTCSSWIPEKTKHVWAVNKGGWWSKTKDGKVLRNYVEHLVNGSLNQKYPSHK